MWDGGMVCVFIFTGVVEKRSKQPRRLFSLSGLNLMFNQCSNALHENVAESFCFVFFYGVKQALTLKLICQTNTTK